MNMINIKFLGIPSITMNDEMINLPYAKAEGVLYLLLYEKSVSREYLSSLLWGDMDTQSSRKNLRNAIYVIRKNTFDDIIISPKRSILQLNDKYEVKSDIDLIDGFDPCQPLDHRIIDEFLNCYNYDFLNEFKIASNMEYLEWINTINLKLNTTYINKLKILSDKLIMGKDFYYGELCSIKLTELEEYGEEGYVNLMKIYQYKGKYQDAVDIYNQLSDKLDKDLSVKPSNEIEKLYKKIVKKIKHDLNKTKIKFWGRKSEKRAIYNNIYRFVGNKSFKSIFISGEDGIGKSLLLNEIVDDLDLGTLLLKIDCYEYESDFIFKFWDKVFRQISDIIKEKNIKIPKSLTNNIAKSFPTLDINLYDNIGEFTYTSNYDLTEKAIFDLFTLLSDKFKIIFIVDDLNNVDNASLKLLYKTILANRYEIMLIASNKDIDEHTEDKFYNLLKYNKIVETIFLDRLDMKETEKFIEKIMPEAKSKSKKIYLESEGNPLFITEIVNSIKRNDSNEYMTDKIENLIKSRLNKLSSEARKLLSICSLFHDKFYIDTLINITHMNEMKLIDVIDELLLKVILTEGMEKGGKLGLDFTHCKIREYVYNNMSNAKKIILHGKIAEYYETKLLRNKKINRTLYPELIYHLSSSNSHCKLFKYKTRWLEEILNFNHEIFPIVQDNISIKPGLIEHYLDEESLEKELGDLNKLHNNIVCKRCDKCLEEKIIYLYLCGRFNKNRGNFKEGLKYLNKMVSLSKENKYHEYTYKAHLQLGHHYLNTNDLHYMEKSIVKAEELTKILKDRCKTAIVWRLKGYLYILLDRYDKGEEYINNALEIFKLSINKERYSLNIVASLYYLGESYRIQELYDIALEYYNKALNLHIDSEDCPAAGLIFSKIGYIKYKQNVIDEAQFYYLKSLKAYEKNIFVWGKAEVYYYLFKIYESKKMMTKAKNYLNESLNYVDKCSNSETKNNIYSALEILA